MFKLNVMCIDDETYMAIAKESLLYLSLQKGVKIECFTCKKVQKQHIAPCKKVQIRLF